MMDSSSAKEKAIETVCVVVGMLGIGNKSDSREGKLEIVSGETRQANHRLLASGLSWIHTDRLQDILYPRSEPTALP